MKCAEPAHMATILQKNWKC